MWRKRQINQGGELSPNTGTLIKPKSGTHLHIHTHTRAHTHTHARARAHARTNTTYITISGDKRPVFCNSLSKTAWQIAPTQSDVTPASDTLRLKMVALSEAWACPPWNQTPLTQANSRLFSHSKHSQRPLMCCKYYDNIMKGCVCLCVCVFVCVCVCLCVCLPACLPVCILSFKLFSAEHICSSIFGYLCTRFSQVFVCLKLCKKALPKI